MTRVQQLEAQQREYTLDRKWATIDKITVEELVSLSRICNFNPLIGILKLQSNGPLYSNTVIGTLAVDGWAVTFGKEKTEEG